MSSALSPATLLCQRLPDLRVFDELVGVGFPDARLDLIDVPAEVAGARAHRTQIPRAATSL